MNVKQGELYSLGPNAYLDDEYIHLDGRRTINEVNLMWRDWFDGLYADGAKNGPHDGLQPASLGHRTAVADPAPGRGPGAHQLARRRLEGDRRARSSTGTSREP